MDTVVTWIKQYGRYVGAGVLFILLVFILVRCAAPGRSSGEEVEDTQEELPSADAFVPDAEFLVDAYPEVNHLIETYFAAYAQDDLLTLESIAYPISNNEKSYIGVFSDYIEEYTNITCYTKSGLTEGSYLVSVYYDLKFYNVQTPAPGLEFFYVQTDAEGELYIDNLYSSYNFARTEYELDSSINVIILKYEQMDDMTQLLSDVNEAYSQAVSGNLDLAEMITTTIPAAMAKWLEDISVSDEEAAKGAEETTEEEPKESESTDEEEEEEEEEPEKITVRTTDNVYIRSGPSTDYDSYKKALKGETYQKVGEEDDWTIIEYEDAEDGIAYMKSEYLEEAGD